MLLVATSNMQIVRTGTRVWYHSEPVINYWHKCNIRNLYMAKDGLWPNWYQDWFSSQQYVLLNQCVFGMNWHLNIYIRRSSNYK
jgi:hypothetical protein